MASGDIAKWEYPTRGVWILEPPGFKLRLSQVGERRYWLKVENSDAAIVMDSVFCCDSLLYAKRRAIRGLYRELECQLRHLKPYMQKMGYF